MPYTNCIPPGGAKLLNHYDHVDNPVNLSPSSTEYRTGATTKTFLLYVRNDVPEVGMRHCTDHINKVPLVSVNVVEFWCFWPSRKQTESMADYPHPHTTGQMTYYTDAFEPQRIPQGNDNCGWVVK